MKKPNEAIKKARLKMGYTQEKTAEKAHISRTMYNQIENGKVPNLRTAYKLAAVLKELVETLFLPSDVI